MEKEKIGTSIEDEWEDCLCSHQTEAVNTVRWRSFFRWFLLKEIILFIQSPSQLTFNIHKDRLKTSMIVTFPMVFTSACSRFSLQFPSSRAISLRAIKTSFNESIHCTFSLLSPSPNVRRCWSEENASISRKIHYGWICRRPYSDSGQSRIGLGQTEIFAR